MKEKVSTPILGRSQADLMGRSKADLMIPPEEIPRALEITEDDEVMFMAEPFDESYIESPNVREKVGK